MCVCVCVYSHPAQVHQLEDIPDQKTDGIQNAAARLLLQGTSSNPVPKNLTLNFILTSKPSLNPETSLWRGEDQTVSLLLFLFRSRTACRFPLRSRWGWRSWTKLTCVGLGSLWSNRWDSHIQYLLPKEFNGFVCVYVCVCVCVVAGDRRSSPPGVRGVWWRDGRLLVSHVQSADPQHRLVTIHRTPLQTIRWVKFHLLQFDELKQTSLHHQTAFTKL